MSSAENATAQETTRFKTASEVCQMIGAFVACLIIVYLGIIFRVVSRRLKEYTSEYDTIEINGLDFTAGYQDATKTLILIGPSAGMEDSQPSIQEEYMLGRSFRESAGHVGIFAGQKQGMLTCLFCCKLHVQHWLWRYRLGYLLRPLIPISSEMRMVDIGTGNASWV